MERKKLLIISAAAVTVVLKLSATGVLALLANYVSITGLATVDQSVTLEECHVSVFDESAGDDTCIEDEETPELDASWTTSAAGGDTRAVGIHLTNNGADGAPIDFVLSATIPEDAVWGSDVTAELFSDYNSVTEECSGTSLGTFDSETDTVSGGTLGGDSDQWYCIELSWDIAAVPGEYGADVSINPAI